jgi:hypothetical protein
MLQRYLNAESAEGAEITSCFTTPATEARFAAPLAGRGSRRARTTDTRGADRR